jgi:hypothetical protein
MAYVPNYSQPTPEDQSYVMLLLSMGVLKRSVPQMVVYNSFPEKEEKVMIETGVKLLNGAIDTLAYVKELEKMCQKVDPSIKFDDYIEAQLSGRLDLSRAATPQNRGLQKTSDQMVTKLGTMKPMSKTEKVTKLTKILEKEIGKKIVLKKKLTEGFVVDPRFEALPSKDKEIIQAVLNAQGVEARVITVQKLDFAIKRLKKLTPMLTGIAKRGALRVLSNLDSNDWKQFKSEPQVKDFQLSSVEPLTEAPLEADVIVNLLTAKPGISFVQILHDLGIAPKSAGQIKIHTTLKKDLLSGAVRREKEGLSFKYYVGNGTPTEMRARVIKPKDPKEILQVINLMWHYPSGRQDQSGWHSNGGSWLSFYTQDRGPRTDHGGGDDGDGWMSPGQINKLKAPYEARWVPRLKELVKALKLKGIKVANYDVDYGEKGHIMLGLEIQR